MATFKAATFFYLLNCIVGEIPLVKFNETIELRTQFFDCSAEYRSELDTHFPECAPHICGRIATDVLLQEHEIDALLELFEGASVLAGGGTEGTTIFELHTGALSKGRSFVNAFSLEPKKENLLRPELMKVYETVQNRIARTIAKNFEIEPDYIYLTYPSFYSLLTSDPQRQINDKYWHQDVDMISYPSIHYTSLIYLSDRENQVTGGRLIFIDGADHDSHFTVEPKRGRVVAFTTGRENQHMVEKMLDGQLLTLKIAFTCDPSKSVWALHAQENDRSTGEELNQRMYHS